MTVIILHVAALLHRRPVVGIVFLWIVPSAV